MHTCITSNCRTVKYMSQYACEHGHMLSPLGRNAVLQLVV